MGISVESTRWLFNFQCLRIELEFENVGFGGVKENRSNQIKNLDQEREPTTNSTHI